MTQAEIGLEGLTFYSYHGFYEEEQKSGNRFIVDIKVIMDLSEGTDLDSIDNTVNYEDLYKLVKAQMEIPYRLLEHLAKAILNNTFSKWENIKFAEVSINKLSPPVGGPCNKAKVKLSKSR